MAGNQQPVVWFHCASLGEFEQGRPIIEQVAQQYPQYKIVLTFFSPSGYEVRKNYPGAHYIFYLPLDTAGNAKRFVNAVNPRLAIFVKYEFWYYYLRELHRRHIPVISVSAIFRDKQVFFKPYGRFYRNVLHLFTHLFTQNKHSAKLLRQHGIQHVTVAGDTRFDRVLQTAAEVKNIPLIAAFKQNDPVFIIGSSWPEDMAILIPFMQQHISTLRFIVAPHEIKDTEINQLLHTFTGQAIRYSGAQLSTVGNFRVMIIDNIGLLSSLYRYGTYGYIGGAFGKGLHNTLEAAVFGLPLFFGPAYNKFQEAIDLVNLNCAFPIRNTTELNAQYTQLQHNTAERTAIGERAKGYIWQQAGATAKILRASHRWLTEAI